MGDINQLLYLKKVCPPGATKVLEIGSKEYGSTINFRGSYALGEYVGTDLAEGAGVDVVCDLTTNNNPLPKNYYDLVICCSVLEHVKKPWLMAEEITKLIVPGGKLFISVPWVWRYHAYPDDYFRFSFQGIESMFDQFSWDNYAYSTTVQDQIIYVGKDGSNRDHKLILKVDVPDGTRQKYLPFLMVNMLGTKNEK